MDPDLASAAERLRGLEVEVRDVARDIERHTDRVESDPGRLAEIEERLAQIEKLRRKYGNDIQGVLRFREDCARELAGIEGAGERGSELTHERGDVEAKLTSEADRLSAARKKAAGKFGRAVQKAVADLDLPDARFEVALEPAPSPANMPCGSLGRESAEFKFSANSGEALNPLRKVASGGELSRVFLAIKNGLRAAAGGMVLVFDEVDAGIGGRAAQRVGRSLAELATHHQVICITHLPQIAAFADVHFRVEKVDAGDRTCATVKRLDAKTRVDEIARMAGGEKVTAATRRHAKDLLQSSNLD
jgi:DNA repair protein RecN (Recombination protein N)